MMQIQHLGNEHLRQGEEIAEAIPNATILIADGQDILSRGEKFW